MGRSGVGGKSILEGCQSSVVSVQERLGDQETGRMGEGGLQVTRHPQIVSYHSSFSTTITIIALPFGDAAHVSILRPLNHLSPLIFPPRCGCYANCPH